MSVALLPLCSTQKQAIRDGNTGQYARLLLPFYEFGYWFANGQQYTFPTAEGEQQQTLTDNGHRMADTYIKNYGNCLRP